MFFSHLNKKIRLSTLLIMSLLSIGPLEATPLETLQILEKAEQYRLKNESAVINCEVEVFKAEQLQKTRLYKVFSGTKERSLVVFQSPADAGQKVLMKGNNFWMFMPKSRRPIRITPMQKLLGDAALGDIATLSWSKQYQVTAQQQTDSTRHFTLEAKADAASYQKIELTLNSPDSFPISADLYLRSGMLAKTATFTRGERDGEPRVVAMTLQDKMKTDNKTVIHYRQIKAMDVPAKLFNPQILIRSDLEQLLMEQNLNE